MKLQRLVPQVEDIQLADYLQLRQFFASRFWAAPSFLLNIVSDPSGRFVGETGSSRDLSNEADYQSLIGYRMAADVILTSAGTARTEGYRRSRFAPLALVSKSANFTGIPAVEKEQAGPLDSKVYLLVKRSQVRKTRAKYNSEWINVVSIGSGTAFGLSFKLTRLGWRRILVEAGPSYANWLLSHSVVRGIALTLVGVEDQTPKEAANAALAALGVTSARLESAERLEGTMFTRWTDIEALKR